MHGLSDNKRTVPDRPTRSPRDARELSRRYASGDEIARGGMGRVIAALDTLLGRTVAVKEALVTDADSLRRFARETRITARLEHPSIVPVYDAGTTDEGLPYYVMRKVSGRPLDHMITGLGKLDDRLKLVPNVLAAAQAIAHAHSRGVIHRDLKPTNILVGAFGETVVIDWGLAKVLDEPDDGEAPIDAKTSLATNYGAVLGTPGYMPPEQLAAGDVDKRADVYALGATLYYLLARKSPHDAASGDAMIEAAAAGPPIPVEELAPGVPRELAAIVAKALAYDTTARYPDAAALAGDLTQFLAGRLVEAHHYGVAERLWRFIAKHRAPLAVAAVAFVVLAVGGYLAVERVIDARVDATTQLHLAEQRRRQLEERELASRIDHARGLVEQNPGAALAQLIPLADSDQWRTVRDLAASARARGIARPLPAPIPTRQVVVSPDGIHAAAVGADGVVRTYDLRTRTVASEQRTSHPVIEYAGTELAILDNGVLRVGTKEIAHDVVTFAASTGGIAWIDRGRRAFTSAGVRATEVLALAIAEDGRVAIVDSRGLSVDRKVLVEGRILATTWSPDGNHLAAVRADEVVDIELPTGTLTAYRGESPLQLGYADGVFVRSGLGGIRSSRAAWVTAAAPDELPVALESTHGGALVAGVVTGTVTVFEGTHRVELAGPSQLTALAANRSSPFVVGLAHGELVVWNLDEVLGRDLLALDMSLATTAAVAPHRLIVGGRSIDLATGASVDLSIGDDLPTFVASPSGHRVACLANGTLTELEPTRRVLASGVRGAIMLDDTHLVIVDDRGVSIDGAIVTPTRIEHLRTAAGMLYGETATGMLLRLDIARGSVTTYPHAIVPTSWAIDSAGGAWIADGAAIIHWDAEPQPHATLPHPAIAVIGIADDRLAVDTADEGELVGLTEPDHVEPVGSFHTSIGGTPTHEQIVIGTQVVASGLAAITRAAGGATLFDFGTNVSWSIGPTSPDVHLSPDGAYAYAFTARGLRVWPVLLPETRGATVAWVHTL
ncbi:MAG: WD40 repeat domain-containing serine/threonine protein kinase [Kofleriaceae bacterium]